MIGSDGFGFVRQPDGTHLKIPQHADVVIEDDVEIGANTTIDRPAVGETRIGAGTKIDNLVQIAHGVTSASACCLPRRSASPAARRSKTTSCWRGRSASPDICASARASWPRAQTGVPNSVDAGTMISGYPAIPNRDWLKASAVFRQLPALKKRVAELEEQTRRTRGEAARMVGLFGTIRCARGRGRVPHLLHRRDRGRATASGSPKHRQPPSSCRATTSTCRRAKLAYRRSAVLVGRALGRRF